MFELRYSDLLKRLRVLNEVGLRLGKLSLRSLTSEEFLAHLSSILSGATSGNTPRTERLPELMVVLESVEFSSLAASHGLLLSLFDLLACLVEVPTANQVEVQYPGQLLLGALGRVVENVQPTSGVTSESIRMAPVLDFMRCEWTSSLSESQKSRLIL